MSLWVLLVHRTGQGVDEPNAGGLHVAGFAGDVAKGQSSRVRPVSPSPVAKHGRPLFVAVPLDEHLLEHGVAVALACRLLAERTVSLGTAAKIAGLSVEAFMQRLGSMGVPAVDYSDEELDREISALGR